MKLSSLLLQVSGHWVLRAQEVNPYVCSSLEQILPLSPLHSTAATQQHFTCQTASNRQNTFYLQIRVSKVVIHLRAACFGSKLFMKNMPLKPRPLKKWEVIVVFKQLFSHSPSFIRTTARLCCVEGSCNVRASVSLVLTAWRYSSTILLCVHLKVQIKPVTLNEIKWCDLEVLWQIEVTKHYTEVNLLLCISLSTGPKICKLLLHFCYQRMIMAIPAPPAGQCSLEASLSSLGLTKTQP